MSVLPLPTNTFGTTPYPTAVPSNQQVVIPQITFPQPYAYGSPSSSPQIEIPGPQLNKVHGIDGAKQFITVANGMYALFDDDDDIFYVKVTDKNNYPVTLKRYRFFEEEEPINDEPAGMVTKEQYETLFEEVQSLKEALRVLKEGNVNAKQSVRSKATKSGTANAVDAEYFTE